MPPALYLAYMTTAATRYAFHF